MHLLVQEAVQNSIEADSIQNIANRAARKRGALEERENKHDLVDFLLGNFIVYVDELLFRLYTH